MWAGAGALGAASLRAYAQPGPANLRGGEILPDPDFTLAREWGPRLVGVRPHRKGGVRLELEEKPLEGASKAMYVVHNYGHGGGGITLAWGTSSVAAELAQKALGRFPQDETVSRSIAILGTGIMGLCTAVELRKLLPDIPITIYAKSLDLQTTTSFIAGGQFEPSIICNEYSDAAKRKDFTLWLQRARDRIVEIQKGGKRLEYGVAERKNYTLDRAVPAFDTYTPRDVIAAPRKGKLPFAKLNANGREYSTWLMNPMILLPKLVKDLTGQKVAFVERSFATKKDVAELPHDVIVNCTGLGSKSLFGDTNMVPQRGHVLALKKTEEKQFWLFSGGCQNGVTCYVFCRQDDIVIGGTIQQGKDSTETTDADTPYFERLMRNATNMFAGKVSACERST